MNNLCAEIGYKSINHDGEQLCGDHIDIVEQNEDSTVIVLADGMGSGVKASILSTLTSKIISTMMAAGLPLEGVDLVTEGVITVNKVVEYANDYISNNDTYEEWGYGSQDGASLISRLLFEEATDINFYVGKAINPAHQNPNLPINFNIKMNLVKELSDALKQMGKHIKVSYF